MEPGQFYRGLFLLVISCLGLTLISYFIPILSAHTYFAIITIVGFSILSLAVFYIGNNLAHSKNKYLYNNLIIINLMLKIFLSLIFIVVYVQFAQPENNLFIILFFLIYIVFTIFEVYFMTKQTKTKK